jgi:hypothetical protein
METRLTMSDLETRWEKALQATRAAVADHPETYLSLKQQAASILDNPIDITEYFPTVEKLTACLRALDPSGHGSIFEIFNQRISPSSIWHVKLLRMECRDLLAHLQAFDQWRREQHHLRMV